ncbi:polyisoprenoid-binding protein [Rhabdochromatium marinum]|nr:polyisoprenoid-binding protein [Rhabdochromatium marinum]
MMKRYFGVLALAAVLAGAALPAFADWVLEPEQSHLAFISIKAQNIAEIHSFEQMTGRVDADGQVTMQLMLDSVETQIPVRNERMRELLFKTADYQQATLSAKIDPAVLDAMQVGEIGQLTGEAVLSLHGQEQPMTMHLQVARVAPDVMLVASRQPLVVDAEKFGLTPGIEQLRELAGLESISHAVPVTFVLTFVQEPAASTDAADASDTAD